MPKALKVRVDTAPLKKYLDAKNAAAKRAADKAAESLSRIGQKIAKEKFASAVYAGPDEHKAEIYVYRDKTKSGYTVEALGKAAMFIEYGTGVSADGTYEGRVPASYVYGAGDGADHTHAHRVGTGDWPDSWVFNSDGSGLPNEAADVLQRARYRIEKGHITNSKGQVLEYEGERVKEHYEVPGSWFTFGNDANNCMFETRQELAQMAPEEIRKALRRGTAK